jgi:hypothetical protein
MNLRFVSPVWLLALYVVVTVLSCKPQPNKELLYDSPSHGSINISVDESFRPVIEEQIAMYQASYPGTVINAQYKTEAECFRDFFRDTSNRVIIVTRRLDEKEEKVLSTRYQVRSIPATLLSLRKNTRERGGERAQRLSPFAPATRAGRE